MASSVKAASQWLFSNSEQALFGTFFLAVVIIIHFIDMLLSFNRIETFFLFAFLYGMLTVTSALGIIFSPAVEPKQKPVLIFSCVIIWIYSLLIPALQGVIFPLVPSMLSLAVDIFFIALPVWVIALALPPLTLYTTAQARWWAQAYVMTWTVVSLILVGSALPEIDVSTAQIGGIQVATVLGNSYGRILEAAEVLASAFVSLTNQIQEFPKMIQRAYERQIKVAAGDYYVGTVDTNAEKPLGVFLENFKPEEKAFYLGEEGKPVSFPVKVAGAIRGQSLDLENCNEYEGRLDRGLYTSKDECFEQQTISLSCGVHGKKIEGKIIPETLNLYDIEGSGEGVDCEIDTSAFPVKDEKRVLLKPEIIDITAHFPFTTKAYLKTYFMDEQRKREMRRANMDIFAFYKISAQPPAAVFTGGPVMIGIGIEQDLPLAVSRTGEQRSTRFGITLENRWKGEIESLTDLSVIPPATVDLVCPVYFEQRGEEWVLKENIKKREGNIKTLKTFNCRIQVRDGGALLEQFPLVESYFKITARYKYKLSKEVTVKLKPGDGEKEELHDCTTFCEDYDECYCIQECPSLLSEIERGKNCNGETPKKKKEEKTEGKNEEKKEERSTPITEEDCGVRIKQCEDYVTQGECYTDTCRFNCRYDVGGILTDGRCLKETESSLKESKCVHVQKCGDYSGARACEDNICQLKPGKCYYDYGDEKCTDCPSTAGCGLYTGEQTCNKDACKVGCIWFMGPLEWGCKPALA